jgi:hypothetical protein
LFVYEQVVDRDKADRSAVPKTLDFPTLGAAMENDNGNSKGGAGPSQLADSSSAQTGIFVRSGDQWTIAYGGTTFSLRDMKGLAYVQRLLQHPYQKFHALDLVGWNTVGVGSETSGAEDRLPAGVSVRGLGDAGAMLDTQAKREYRARLRDLRQELEELRKGADHERGEKVEAEIDFIEREIIVSLDSVGVIDTPDRLRSGRGLT